MLAGGDARAVAGTKRSSDRIVNDADRRDQHEDGSPTVGVSHAVAIGTIARLAMLEASITVEIAHARRSVGTRAAAASDATPKKAPVGETLANRAASSARTTVLQR